MRSGPIDSMRAARCEAGPVTSTFSTSCPPARSPSAIASTVSTVSNSASSSLSVSRRLWVNAILIEATLLPTLREVTTLTGSGFSVEPFPVRAVGRHQLLGAGASRRRRSPEQDAAPTSERLAHLLRQLLEVVARTDQVLVDSGR